VRHTPGGVFTDHVFANLKVRDLLRFEGPLGSFYLREDSSKPIVMVASGTGFAPIRAICDYAREKKIERPITLYWGGRLLRDLYQLDVAQSWPHVKFIPVLSDEKWRDAWASCTAPHEDFPTNRRPVCGGAPTWSSRHGETLSGASAA
jgi:CDP-4-dehydro-6-deoxyglucose reductase